MDPAQLITTVGFPIAVVIGIGFAIAKVARWLAPRLDEVKSAHVDHVKASTSAQAIHADANARNSASMEKVAAAVEKDAEALMQIAHSNQQMADSHRSLERTMDMLARSHQEVARAVCVTKQCEERIGVAEIVEALRRSIGHEDLEDSDDT